MMRFLGLLNIILFLISSYLAHKVYEVWETGCGAEASQLLESDPAMVSLPRLSPMPVKSREAFNEIITKDLFRPERTEWKPLPAPKEGEAEEKPNIRIHGIAICDGLKHAWIKSQSAGSNKSGRGLVKVSEGDDVDGWKVTRINEDGIILARQDDRIVCRLIEPGDPKMRAASRIQRAKAKQGGKPKKEITRRVPRRSRVVPARVRALTKRR